MAAVVLDHAHARRVSCGTVDFCFVSALKHFIDFLPVSQ